MLALAAFDLLALSLMELLLKPWVIPLLSLYLCLLSVLVFIHVLALLLLLCAARLWYKRIFLLRIAINVLS